MEIVVNGQGRVVRDALTLVQLLEELELSGGPVAIEVNREIVPRALHASRTLSPGDVVEIVHFVGGG